MTMNITAEQAHELLFIDAEGLLRWKVARGMQKAGSVAGTVKARGWRDLTINKKTYRAARVIWLMTHGEWPTVIDHINRNRSDDRIENLRNVDFSQSSSNRVMPPGVLKTKGVTPHSCGKYQAQIGHRGKTHYLGLHSTPEQAAEAYRLASERLHGEHGVRS